MTTRTQQLTPHDIRAARERLGLSQVALADQMGVSASLVEKWEQGARQISKSHAKLLELLLD